MSAGGAHDAHLAGEPLESGQVGAQGRADERVGHGGLGAFDLARFAEQGGGQGDVVAGAFLGEDVGDADLVAVVGPRVQQADDPAPGGGVEGAQGDAQRALIEGSEHFAARTSPSGDADSIARCNEHGTRTGLQRVEVGLVTCLASDVEQVGESGVGDQADACAAPLEERVGRDGGPVDEPVERGVGRDARDRGADRLVGSAGSGRHLGRDESAAEVGDDVGEGAAGVDGDADLQGPTGRCRARRSWHRSVGWPCRARRCGCLRPARARSSAYAGSRRPCGP